IATEFVIIAGNRVARVGGVKAVVVNLAETDMAVGEADDTLGVAVERRVFAAGLAFVPRERGVGGPFHEEKGQFAMFDIGETPAGDVGEAGEGYAIEDVAAEIEARVAAKGGGIGVAAVAGAGEDAVARGRIGGQAQVA